MADALVRLHSLPINEARCPFCLGGGRTATAGRCRYCAGSGEVFVIGKPRFMEMPELAALLNLMSPKKDA